MKFNLFKKHSSDDTQVLIDDLQHHTIAPIAVWRLWLPLLIQTGLILAVPAQPIYTLLTGKTAILQTLPVDPYDPLRGYSVTLRYDISRPATLQKLPGWMELVRQNPAANATTLAAGTQLYVILQAQQSTASIPPAAWQPVRVSGNHPKSVAVNEVALKGRYNNGTVTYGLETYYIPETQREQINRDIAQAQQTGVEQQQPIVVVKVDTQGKAVPTSFWIQNRNYRF